MRLLQKHGVDGVGTRLESGGGGGRKPVASELETGNDRSTRKGGGSDVLYEILHFLSCRGRSHEHRRLQKPGHDAPYSEAPPSWYRTHAFTIAQYE